MERLRQISQKLKQAMIILVKINFNEVDDVGLPLSPGIREARLKFIAAMLLARRKGIVVPTYAEWVGVNLLERDDEQ